MLSKLMRFGFLYLFHKIFIYFLQVKNRLKHHIPLFLIAWLATPLLAAPITEKDLYLILSSLNFA
jgi:hypothetical protein